MTRGQLYDIYRRLSNDQKVDIAEAAQYTSYRGLYRYVSKGENELARRGVVNAFKSVLGESFAEDYEDYSPPEAAPLQTETDLFSALIDIIKAIQVRNSVSISITIQPAE